MALRLRLRQLCGGMLCVALARWLRKRTGEKWSPMVLQSPRYDRPREQTLGRGHT